MNRAIPLGMLKKRFALGNDRFKSEIERLTGRRLTIGKPGPKPGRRGSGDVRGVESREFLL